MSIITTILLALVIMIPTVIITTWVEAYRNKNRYEPLLGEAREAYSRERRRNTEMHNSLCTKYIGSPVWSEGKVVLAKVISSFSHKENDVRVVYANKDKHGYQVFTDENGEEVPKNTILYWMDITNLSKLK